MTEPMRPKTRVPRKDMKWWLIGGGVAFIAVYYMYRKQSQSSATTVTDPNAVASTDQYGTSNFGGPFGNAPSAYGYYDPSTGAFITPGGTTSTITAPTTESAWVQQASAMLRQQGIDTAPFLTGVANWLHGPNRLSDAEYNAVESGISLLGVPPGATTVPVRAQTNQTTTFNFLSARTAAYAIGSNYTAHGKPKEAAGAIAAANHISSPDKATDIRAVQAVVSNYYAHKLPEQAAGATTVLQSLSKL